MDYPNHFYTPVFPKSRGVAFSRSLAIWILITFFAIFALCGLLWWSAHSVRLAPFLISINQTTGEWKVVSEKTGNVRPMPGWSVMQEAVVGNFSRQWFEILGTERGNEANWCKCERRRCAQPLASDINQYGGNMCFLCCRSGDRLYQMFADTVLLDRRARAADGEMWVLRNDHNFPLVIEPVSRLAEAGGLWRVFGTLESNKTGRKKIEAYVRVSRHLSDYPLTLGYYVVEFNAYQVE
ncbi:MAG: hypothetical protein FWG80_00535 [Alphaproteobacteria bacterium]|nr:hypothetical protein [Alphaproteobacteria bacterium]